jgi:localization factor PodJL
MVIVLVLFLPLLGYFGGRYLEQDALADPQERLQVALRAADSGYDYTALRLLEPLAEAGNATAQYHLATMYDHGLGTSRNASKALELYTQAAEQSNVPAETRLGEVYLHGTLVLQDLAKARQWFEKAAVAESSEAQLQLAEMYQDGLGVQPDPIEAYGWYAVAASQGDAVAADRRDRILKTMAASDQAKAEARAAVLQTSLKRPSGTTI